MNQDDALRRSEERLRQANAALDEVSARLEQQVRQREEAEAQVRHLSEDLLRASEARLQNSEERFRQLLDVVPVAIYASDAEGLILEYNQAAVAFWGKRPKPGANFRDLYQGFSLERSDGTSLANELGPLSRALAQGQSVRNAQLGVDRPDGSRVETLINTALVRDADGCAVGTINCVLDITELCQAQRQLSTNQRLAQATLDALSAHICVLDETGTILAVNRAWNEFGASNGGEPGLIGEGANYLAECNRAFGDDQGQAEAFIRGLRHVMRADREHFSLEYSCHSRQDNRWFVARVTRCEVDGAVRVVVVHENITERRWVEEQLKEKGALLRIAGGIARLGGWVYRLADQNLVWSDEVGEIHGVPHGHSPTLQDALNYIAPEYRDRIANEFNKCIEQGIPLDEEMQIINVTGERVWARVTGLAIGDEHGSIVRAQGAFQDISGRKQQEERVTRIAERLTTTLESITDGFFTLDREWRFTYVNREAERILQRTRQQLLGRSVWEEFADSVGTEFERQYRNAAEHQQTAEFEAYYPALSLWVEVHVYPSDEGIAVYFRDVSKRKDAELALRRSEESLRLAVTAGGLGTWLWDVGTQNVQVSNQTKIMLGISEHATMTFGDFIDALHPQDRGPFVETLQDAADRRKDFRADFRIVRPDGSIRWLAALGRANVEDGGESVRMEGLNLDITERKRTEWELLEINERLEQRVEQRTRELAAAKQQAESANAAKSAFLATMSHEIRTPMNGIVGMVEILAHGRLTEHQSEAVRTIRESAFSLLHLIDDILDFSKIEAGRLELERTPVAISEVVEGVCDTLSSLADSENVDLFVFVSPEGPAQVWSDPVRLRQIFFNLVGNAIKFSGGRPKQRGRVELRLEVMCASPLTVLIRVEDNGIGMTESTQQHLFQSFSQAEVSTTRRFGGTGLGLVICKRIVDLMGGVISVKSAPGQGATFAVELPLEPVSGETLDTFPDLVGLEFILVEGPSINAVDLRTYLDGAGARTHVTNGEEAIRASASLAAPVVVVNGISDDRARAEWLGYFRHLPDVRHLIIARGRRRKARLAGPNVVTIDGNSMRRRTFLHAAAVAAGRASPETEQQRAENSELIPPVSAPTVAEARANGQLILIAEDDTTSQKVLLRQLELLGYAAEIASDGLEALRLWRNGNYALLLTDVHMPVLDGYGLTAAIRLKEGERRRTPILALTANALRGEASRSKAAGLDEYLTKPMQLSVLRETLDKWMPKNPPPAPEHLPASAERPRNQHPVLNIQILKSIVGDDPSTLREVLVDFDQSVLGAIEDLHSSSIAGDLEAIGMIAHRLKSSSRTVGALLVGDLCAGLENSCRLADKDGAAQNLALLEPALTELLACVGNCLAGECGSPSSGVD